MLVSVDVNKIFEKYRAEKIALYGLGTETEKTVRALENDYEIVGLLDSFRVDGELYGKQIISLDDALNASLKLIIVVARPGSCRAITKKIGSRCREKGIALMDIRGKDLLEIKEVSYIFSNVDGITKVELEEKIEKADVISFDLFDTLVMRQTLFSDDIAEYVDCRLREGGIFIEDFCTKRMESEKRLSRNMAPTLIEIYQNMLENLNNKNVNVTAEKLAKLEWDTDFDMLVPRKEMCDIFVKTIDSGKSVYIVSDTYYNKNQLVKVLSKCGITKYTDILASSDYGISKSLGLYHVLKEREKSKKYLHIGDDIVSDIEKAHNCGFDTYKVFSGLDLLEDAGGLGLLNCAGSLSDRLKTGMFVSNIFNSPFQFENKDKKIEIKDAYDIGYLLFAPIISDFVLWFFERMKEQKFLNIWFSARDGYLIKKMYSHLLELCHREDSTVYFLVSRTAAIRAGVKDEEDIRYVDEMKFSGTLEECLKERFGIDANSVKTEDILPDQSGLIKYKNVILANASREYENYHKYIGRLNIKEGDIAFFDFVAKGTTQMYIQRLTDNRLKGFYFLQLEHENMKDKGIDVCSFYENDDTSVVFDNYYILEPLLTAPHSSVIGFDRDGKPVYSVETRQDKDIRCFQRAQEGIFEYFKTYVKLCPKLERKINRDMDGVLLKLIHGIRITDRDFLNLVVEDPFFNRMTNITDII